MALKKYATNQRKVLPKDKKESSGVACDEKKCDGEMMIDLPVSQHPEIPKLRRAQCGVCGWLGWV